MENGNQPQPQSQPLSIGDYLRLQISSLREQKSEAERTAAQAQAHLNQVIGALHTAEQFLANLQPVPESTGDALATEEDPCPAST